MRIAVQMQACELWNATHRHRSKGRIGARLHAKFNPDAIRLFTNHDDFIAEQDFSTAFDLLEQHNDKSLRWSVT